jgi:hypothetical protein
LSHRFQAGLREFVSGGGPDLASETWTVSPVSANSTRFSPYRSMPVKRDREKRTAVAQMAESVMGVSERTVSISQVPESGLGAHKCYG